MQTKFQTLLLYDQLPKHIVLLAFTLWTAVKPEYLHALSASEANTW